MMCITNVANTCHLIIQVWATTMMQMAQPNQKRPDTKNKLISGHERAEPEMTLPFYIHILCTGLLSENCTFRL